MTISSLQVRRQLNLSKKSQSKIKMSRFCLWLLIISCFSACSIAHYKDTTMGQRRVPLRKEYDYSAGGGMYAVAPTTLVFPTGNVAIETQKHQRTSGLGGSLVFDFSASTPHGNLSCGARVPSFPTPTGETTLRCSGILDGASAELLVPKGCTNGPTVLTVGQQTFEINPEYWHFGHYTVAPHGLDPIVEVSGFHVWESKGNPLSSESVSILAAALSTWQRAKMVCAG